MDSDLAAGAPHVPVLLAAVLEHAAVQPGDTIVDGTFGAGGHSRALAAQLGGVGRLIGVDRDASVAAGFAAVSAGLAPLETRFCNLDYPSAFDLLAREGVSADVVILDIGVSSMQLDQPARGFAYSYDAPLDMRMDQSSGRTARDVLADAPEHELERILRQYGEERFARRIAHAIVQRRGDAPLERTAELAELVRRAVPAATRRKGGHPAKRTFQALRIEVNDELGMLDRGLDAAFELLKPGGRLLVISFHSLEDRMVKRRIEKWRGHCTCPPGLPVCGCGWVSLVEPLTRGAVQASADEAAENPRAVSARLRAVRKLAQPAPGESAA